MNILCVIVFYISLQIRRSHSFVLPVPLRDESLDEECLLPVLDSANARNVYFICDVHSTFCPSNILHHGSPRSWIYCDSSEEIRTNFYKPYVCVLASQDMATMNASLVKSDMCHRANIILIVPSDTVPDLAEMKTVFDTAWDLGIIDIVILVKSSSYCKVYSYIPFSPNKCYDNSPTLVNSWKRDVNLALRGKADYFPTNRIKNLYSCKILFDDTTYSSMYWFPVDNMLERATGSSFQGVTFESLLIASSLSKIVFQLIKVDTKAAQICVIPSILSSSTYVLVVPRRPDSSLGWFRLLNEFSMPVWCGVLVSFVTSVIVLYIFLKTEKDFVFIIILTFRPLLGAPVPRFPQKGRIFILSYLLLGFVISSSYHSKLLSKLSVPSNEDVFKNLQDFIKSDVVIHVSNQYGDFIDSHIAPNPRYQYLLNKIIYVNSSYDDIDDSRSDIAYIIDEDDFSALFKNMPYRILPDEVLAQHMIIPFVLFTPSPLEQIFKLAYLRVAGAGAFEYVRLENIRKNARFTHFERLPAGKGHKPLTLDSLAAIFVIWLWGCGLATIVFIF